MYYALPHVRDPKSHPSLGPVFLPRWVAKLRGLSGGHGGRGVVKGGEVVRLSLPTRAPTAA